MDLKELYNQWKIRWGSVIERCARNIERFVLNYYRNFW